MPKPSIILLLLFSMALLASAATFYISPSGSDTNSGSLNSPFKTVQKGVNSLSLPGDILYLRAGTYKEVVYRTDFGGSQANPMVIRNYPGELAILDGSNTGAPLTLWRINDIVIDGLTLINGGACTGTFSFGNLCLGRGDRLQVRNLDVYGNNAECAGASGLMYLEMQSNMLVENNNVHNATFIPSNPWNCGGIAFDSADYVTASNNIVVRNNIIHDLVPSGSGIWHKHPGTVGGFDIYNNTIYNVFIGAFIRNQNTHFHNNLIYKVNGDAADFRGGITLTLEGTAQLMENFTFDYNTIATCPNAPAFNYRFGRNVKLNNNIFFECNPGTGEMLHYDICLYNLLCTSYPNWAGISFIKSDNNCFYYTPTSKNYLRYLNTQYTLAQAKQQFGFDVNSFNVNPQFISTDPASPDFLRPANSQCAGMGYYATSTGNPSPSYAPSPSVNPSPSPSVIPSPSPSVNPSPSPSVAPSPSTGASPTPAPNCEATGSGKCYYISGTGSDSNNGLSAQAPWKSFANIDSSYCSRPIPTNLASGDIVYLMNGIYTTGCAGQMQVFLHDGSPSNVKIKAYPGQHPIIDSQSQPDVVGIRLRNVNGWTISGLEIRNTYAQSDSLEASCIKTYNFDNSLIENNDIHDCYGNTGSNVAGIKIGELSYNDTIRNNTIHHGWRTVGSNEINNQGIVMFEGNNHRIYNNEIYDMGSGIFYKHHGCSENGEPLYNEVYRNYIHNVRTGGIYWGTDNSLIYENIVDNASYGIRFPFGDPTACGATFENNSFFRNSFYDITGTYDWGWGNGIFISEGTRLGYLSTIRDNVVQGDTMQHWYNLDNLSTEVKYSDYNCYASNAFKGVVNSLAALQALDYDIHSKITTDQFANAPAGNYRLSSTSPCRNSGSDGLHMGAYIADNVDYSIGSTYVAPTAPAYPSPSIQPSPSPSIIPCSENWSCTNWGVCANSTQTRACLDLNSCGSTINKPVESQICTMPSPSPSVSINPSSSPIPCQESWSCTGWNSCSGGSQSRLCTDANSCGTALSQPALSQGCTMPSNSGPSGSSNSGTSSNVGPQGTPKPTPKLSPTPTLTPKEFAQTVLGIEQQLPDISFDQQTQKDIQDLLSQAKQLEKQGNRERALVLLNQAKKKLADTVANSKEKKADFTWQIVILFLILLAAVAVYYIKKKYRQTKN